MCLSEATSVTDGCILQCDTDPIWRHIGFLDSDFFKDCSKASPPEIAATSSYVSNMSIRICTMEIARQARKWPLTHDIQNVVVSAAILQNVRGSSTEMKPSLTMHSKRLNAVCSLGSPFVV